MSKTKLQLQNRHFVFVFHMICNEKYIQTRKKKKKRKKHEHEQNAMCALCLFAQWQPPPWCISAPIT